MAQSGKVPAGDGQHGSTVGQNLGHHKGHEGDQVATGWQEGRAVGEDLVDEIWLKKNWLYIEGRANLADHILELFSKQFTKQQISVWSSFGTVAAGVLRQN